MKNYIVIARIAKTHYMVNVMAETECAAEHAILDMGICGRHEYSVEHCMAFDYKSMKTDTFIGHALLSTTVSLEEITRIINTRNEEITAKDAAEDRIREIEKQMKELEKELEAAKKIVAA